MRAFRAGVVAALAGLAVGCGGGRVYEVSGEVRYDGRPVPAGQVYFEPDAAKGATGRPASATVTDGRYTAAAGGGPYTVRVLGYDGKPANESPLGRPLFAEHRESRELPAADSVQNFDIPRKR